jgi:hypothetical protein
MKRLILSFLTVVAVVTIKAQMIAYSVSTNVVGEPGESTVIDLQGVTGKELSGLIIDADGNMEFESVVNAKGFPIGFDFMYNGKKMTHFLIGTDLEIQLSPGESVSTQRVLPQESVRFLTESAAKRILYITCVVSNLTVCAAA